MNAEQVRTYVAAKWPKAMQSPLANAMCAASALALLESSDADAVSLRGQAMEHAEACLRACDGWTAETLGFNIESAMGGELEADECDEIARIVLARQRRAVAANLADRASVGDSHDHRSHP